MKKEFYKLSIVFTMILFAFSLAFFLGKEVTLSGQQQSKKQSSPSPHTSPVLSESKISTEDFTDKQREKVKEYKKTLSQEEPSEEQNPLNNKEKIKSPDIKKDLKIQKKYMFYLLPVLQIKRQLWNNPHN